MRPTNNKLEELRTIAGLSYSEVVYFISDFKHDFKNVSEAQVIELMKVYKESLPINYFV